MILSLPCEIKSLKCVTFKISLDCNFEKKNTNCGHVEKMPSLLEFEKEGSQTRLSLMMNRGQLTFLLSKEGVEGEGIICLH